MRLLRRLTLGMLGAGVVLEALGWLLPVPGFVTRDIAHFKIQTLVVVALALSYLITAVLFAYGARGFKPQMRRSYQILVVSMVFFGVINFQYPVLRYLSVIPGPWNDYGLSLMVVVPGIILHYAAARHFARVLGVSGQWMSVRLMMVVGGLAAFIGLFIPHVHEFSDWWFALHQVVAVAAAVMHVFAAGILLVVLREIGASYKPAIRWWMAGSWVAGIAYLHVMIAALSGQHNQYTLQGATVAPFILDAVIYLVAGYQFASIRFKGLLAPVPSGANGLSIIDAVVGAASLISNPSKVNDELNILRQITAGLAPGAELSAVDRKRLVWLYLALENYLVKHERLRTFTREGLRARLSEPVLREVEQAVMSA